MRVGEQDKAGEDVGLTLKVAECLRIVLSQAVPPRLDGVHAPDGDSLDERFVEEDVPDLVSQRVAVHARMGVLVDGHRFHVVVEGRRAVALGVPEVRDGNDLDPETLHHHVDRGGRPPLGIELRQELGGLRLQLLARVDRNGAVSQAGRRPRPRGGGPP